MNRKSNPWVALVALILLLVLVVCVCTGCKDPVEAAVEVKETDRFVTEEYDTVSATIGARVVKDTETGVRYLVISYGQGIGVTKLEEGER